MITASVGLLPELRIRHATGLITAEELRTAAVDFVREAPTRLALWDFTDADFSALPVAGLVAVFDAVVPYMSNRQGGRSALLFNSPVGFGLGRMSEAFAEVRGYPCQIRAFRDWADAMRWLQMRPDEVEEGEDVA